MSEIIRQNLYPYRGYVMERVETKIVLFTLLFIILPWITPSAGTCDEPLKFALTGAKVYTVTGSPLDNATILVNNGRFEKIGKNISLPPGYRVIQLNEGYCVYPALIDADSNMGRIEIGSVRGSVDIAEVGEIHPDVKAEIAVNADSEHIRVTRSNGVFLSNTVPRGGIISGTSALIQHEGWNWQEMVIKTPVALHVHWPTMKITRKIKRKWYETKLSPEKQEKERDRKLKLLKESFAKARAYLKAKNTVIPGVIHEIDPRWEAMKPVLEKIIPVIVHAHGIRQIKTALEWAETEDIKLVIAGGKDAWRLASKLAKKQVPVILEGIHGMPKRDWEPYDLTYTMAAKLYEKKVLFCIANGGGASNNRNLPYLAAKAAAFGLPMDEALKTITLYPAQILGIDHDYGSIEPGKKASFFVTDGDILDTRTHVIMAFMDGKQINLMDRQKRLYERYRKRPKSSLN